MKNFVFFYNVFGYICLVFFGFTMVLAIFLVDCFGFQLLLLVSDWFLTENQSKTKQKPTKTNPRLLSLGLYFFSYA